METFDISCLDSSADAALFRSVANQGIDSRLEAFTKSSFHGETVAGRVSRLYLHIHPSELSILLRRLDELETEESDQWVSNIIESHYGVELY